MSSQKLLKKIDREILACKTCRRDSLGIAVPGEGSANAKVVFVGEAPGKKEAASGRPFIGRSGMLLRSTLAQADLREKDVYITSPVKYLPRRGTPTPQQIAHGRTHILKQLAAIKPKVVVLMGRVAALGILDEPVAVSKLHGTSRKQDGRIYFFSYHPAAAIRFTKFRKTFIDDFKKLKKLIK